jgi:alpha-tubulin suppressor-like RCC1 family protein
MHRVTPLLLSLAVVAPAAPAAADDGVVAVAWGDNGFVEPREGFRNAVEVSAGGNHTAIRRADGSFSQVGANNFGQVDVPFSVRRLSRIEVGATFVAGLTTDGTLRVWGGGTASSITVPPDLGPVSQVAAGGSHVLVITNAGTLRAFGSNSQGQASVPPDVLSGARSISAGDVHSLAVRADGTVRCWGSNTYGQSSAPPFAGAVTIAKAGMYHNLAQRGTARSLAGGSMPSGSARFPRSSARSRSSAPAQSTRWRCASTAPCAAGARTSRAS